MLSQASVKWSVIEDQIPGKPKYKRHHLFATPKEKATATKGVAVTPVYAVARISEDVGHTAFMCELYYSTTARIEGRATTMTMRMTLDSAKAWVESELFVRSNEAGMTYLSDDYVKISETCKSESPCDKPKAATVNVRWFVENDRTVDHKPCKYHHLRVVGDDEVTSIFLARIFERPEGDRFVCNMYWTTRERRDCAANTIVEKKSLFYAKAWVEQQLSVQRHQEGKAYIQSDYVQVLAHYAAKEPEEEEIEYPLGSPEHKQWLTQVLKNKPGNLVNVSESGSLILAYLNFDLFAKDLERRLSDPERDAPEDVKDEMTLPIYELGCLEHKHWLRQVSATSPNGTLFMGNGDIISLDGASYDSFFDDLKHRLTYSEPVKECMDDNVDDEITAEHKKLQKVAKMFAWLLREQGLSPDDTVIKAAADKRCSVDYTAHLMSHVEGLDKHMYDLLIVTSTLQVAAQIYVWHNKQLNQEMSKKG